MRHTSTKKLEALRLAELIEREAKEAGRFDYKHKAADELRRLHARVQELEADALDAKRYRWLRRNIGVQRINNGAGPVSPYLLIWPPAKDSIAEETDAAIDAAIAAQAVCGGAA